MKNTRINLKRLRTFTNGDANIEQQLLQLFVKQSELNLQMLASTCVDGDNKSWIYAAHTLKGASANIGAIELSSLCDDAQQLVNGTAAKRHILFTQIQAEYTEVKHQLQETGFV